MVFRTTFRALVVVPVDADIVDSLGIETTGFDLGDTDSGDATGDKVWPHFWQKRQFSAVVAPHWLQNIGEPFVVAVFRGT